MNYQERENRISEWWRLAEEFTIHEAALLIIGFDPHCETGVNCKNWKPNEQPDGYGAVVRAITGALGPKVSGRHIPHYDTDINGNICGELEGTTDIHCSTVVRDSLESWLKSRGVNGGFFFPDAATTDIPGYLDPKNPRFAPKLEAAIKAWQAVTETNGKSPKQALMKWLREHAAEFGLSDEEGKPYETGIEEVAKVANWQLGGGPGKTPGA